jgi:Predicted transcriptional regulators
MPTPPSRRASPVHISRCTLAASFDFLGDRWSLLILRSALFGLRRYDDFQKELGIPRTVLAARLKRLVAAGLMIPMEYREDGSRPRKEYVLTAMGEALRLPFLAMRQWSDQWVGAGSTPPFRIARRSDGASVHIAYVDDKGQPVPEEDLVAHFADWAPLPIKREA